VLPSWDVWLARNIDKQGGIQADGQRDVGRERLGLKAARAVGKRWPLLKTRARDDAVMWWNGTNVSLTLRRFFINIIVYSPWTSPQRVRSGLEPSKFDRNVKCLFLNFWRNVNSRSKHILVQRTCEGFQKDLRTYRACNDIAKKLTPVTIRI